MDSETPQNLVNLYEEKAQEFLADNSELARQSEQRAAHHIQETAVLFHDFMDTEGLYKDTTERRPITEAERQRMDRYLTDLGKIVIVNERGQETYYQLPIVK